MLVPPVRLFIIFTFGYLPATVFCLNLFTASAQSLVREYSPAEIVAVDLSLAKSKELERRNKLLSMEKRTVQEQKELEQLLEKHDETKESIWDVISGGCSWYCGGGNYYIKASSCLADSTGIAYSELNANDLSYQTAWVAGKGKDGIGEYLEYYFKNESARITRIIISNGYVKSNAAWHNNNRVKKINLYVNGRLYGVLKLEDSRSDQYFDIGTLGRNKDGSDLILRFEIAEVYKGEKYDDTAITEIYFDGIDVH